MPVDKNLYNMDQYSKLLTKSLVEALLLEAIWN